MIMCALKKIYIFSRFMLYSINLSKKYFQFWKMIVKLYDISVFKVGDDIYTPFSKMEYRVLQILSKTVQSSKHKYIKSKYSIIKNIETGKISNATHLKNKCFIKI